MKRWLYFSMVGICLSGQSALADNFTVDIWVDNWFQFNINGRKVAEDSVPITTERSFNAEQFTFEADRPFVIGVIAKDFKENNTGLEYIGSRRQQMGDGGLIAQIRDSDGNAVVVTNALWRCLVVHEAPLDKDCEKVNKPIAGEGLCKYTETEVPTGWDTKGFNDNDWLSAQVYSNAAVSPKGGYDRIDWDDQAELIWGPDLETNNTLLCRLEID